jgi:hypothetical protein
MPSRLTRLGAMTLTVVALGMTLRAEESVAHKKKEAAHAPRAQAGVKAVSPQTLSSTTLSELLVNNFTLAPGASQQVFAKTDFSGADKVQIGFYGANDQDFSKTAYLVWWAPPGAPNYVVADYIQGSDFSFLNSGGVQLVPYGNQLMIEFRNNGSAPVTYIQVTAYAVAR